MDKITVSAPGKIHLLGEHSVVYGKPAILAAVNLTVTVILRVKPEGSRSLSADESETSSEILRSAQNDNIRKIIEPIVKKELKIKSIPPYDLTITSQVPVGAGLGSSAAISAAYIGVLLAFLKIKWDLNLINKLTYEAEKVFHGSPSGGDNSTIVYGGLLWFRKEDADLKIIHPLPFSISSKLSKKFILINTGKPKEITAEMVKKVKELYIKKPKVVEAFLSSQEKLVKELLPVLKQGDEKEFIRIIKEGERNLENIEVVSKSTQEIIRKIEGLEGAAKICGAGGSKGPSGILLAYHPDKDKLEKLIKTYQLPYFSTSLGVEGLKSLN